MLSKRRRQQLVVGLVGKHRVGTQIELTRRLSRAGVEVTQATVSRDIRELGLRKVRDEMGNAHYSVADDDEPSDPVKACRHMLEEVVITFKKGVPVGMDDQGMDSVALINRVDEIGGAHGFGRVDMIENRLVGLKNREIYEVHGALAMIMAHRELEDLTVTRDLSHFKRGVEQRLADMIYDGQWLSPLSDALRVFVEESQKNVTGDVRLRFHKGSCLVTGRRSPNSLYQESLATYGTGDIFSHESAQGFVNLWGLPLEVWSRTSRGSA